MAFRYWAHHPERSGRVVFFDGPAYRRRFPPVLSTSFPRDDRMDAWYSSGASALLAEEKRAIRDFLGDVGMVVDPELLGERAHRSVYHGTDDPHVLLRRADEWTVYAIPWRFAFAAREPRPLGDDREATLRELLEEVLRFPLSTPAGDALPVLESRELDRPREAIYVAYDAPPGEGFCGGRFGTLLAATDGRDVVCVLEPLVWRPNPAPEWKRRPWEAPPEETTPPETEPDGASEVWARYEEDLEWATGRAVDALDRGVSLEVAAARMERSILTAQITAARELDRAWEAWRSRFDDDLEEARSRVEAAAD